MSPAEIAPGRIGKLTFTVLGPALAYGVAGVLAVAGIWYEFAQIDRNLETVARERGAVLFRLIELTRDWNAEHGGVYVPITPATQPNPYLDDPQRDVVTVDGQRLTKINPAFMTRQISEIAARAQGLQFHITSLKPIRPANDPDSWERESLAHFENGARERISLVGLESGAPVHRYMAPLLVKPSCMKCHSGQGYRVGDIRGGISVSTPAADLLAVRDAQRLRVKWFALIFFAALAGLSHLLIVRARRHYESLWRVTTRQEVLIADRTAELSAANERLVEDARQRERDQRRLAESEARYRTAVESSREGAIGRITLGSFRVGSAERFGEKLKALGDIKGLIVDLRGNPGGSLDEAVGIADLFLGEGPVVRVRARATSEQLYQSQSGGEFAAPVAVLIDGQSASAAEVLAGALQRRGRASLFGSRSWGKGSVQRYYEYEDGSALKLTFARYYLPDDRSVEGVGLEPDFTVEAAAGDDRVLRSALEWLRKQAPPG